MLYLNFGWVRKTVMYTLYIMITAAFISNIAMAYDKVDIQKKVNESSFSKISHKAGLERVHERFTHIIRNSKYKHKGKDWAELFSKDLSSAEVSAFINAMVKKFNIDHDMRKSTFVLADKHIDSAGNLHIIMSQQINNIKVDAGKVVLHFNKEGNLYDVSGQIQDDLAIQTTPVISEEDAVTAGKKVIESKSELSGSPKLSIVGERLSYIVMLSEQDIPGYWKVIVDAQSGEILEKSSTLRFLNPPGWPNNGNYAPITGNIYTHEGGFSVIVNGWYDNSTDLYYLFNDDEDWQIQYLTLGSPYLYSYNLDNWGTTNPQAMSLAYNFGRIVSFVKNTMNRDCYDGAGATALVRFFPDSGMGTGIWSNPYIFLHSGYTENDLTIYDCVVLDAVAHEYGHAMTEYASGLEVSGEPGALDEGYADIFAMCIEEAFQADSRDQYPFGQRSTEATFDWLFGEDTTRNNGQRWWLRNMREPWVGGKEGNEPSLYKGTDWNGERHNDSTVLSFAFYLISEGVGVESINDTAFQHRYGPFPGIGIDKAREISWGSQFNGRIPSYADFRIARNAWLYTAQDLKYDAGVVAQAFAAIGVIDRTVGRPAGTSLPTNPPNYTTISDAINAAQFGDLIYVYPGTYVENLNITLPGITIVSRNRELTTIEGTVTFSASADRNTLTGFTIDADSNVTGIVINGTNIDPKECIVISGNTIRNCNTAVSLSYATHNTIINNKFQSGAGGSVVLDNSTYNFIMENKIDGGGIFFNAFNSYNQVVYNRWNNVTTDGVNFSITNSSNTGIWKNDFVVIDGRDITSSIPLTDFTCTSNVFSNQNGLVFNIPLWIGIVRNNTFSPNSYSITSTTLDFNNNYWSDYLGQDTNGDGLGDTDVPHADVDYAPLMNPKAKAINFRYNNSLLMSSTVMDGKFRVAGTAGSGTVEGLKFGANSSLTTIGRFIGSQILINSGKWLDQVTNLTGGLVLYDAEGKPQMHISADGIVRIRGNMSFGF